MYFSNKGTEGQPRTAKRKIQLVSGWQGGEDEGVKCCPTTPFYPKRCGLPPPWLANVTHSLLHPANECAHPI